MSKPGELIIPDGTESDPKAFEVVRVWIVNKGLHVSLRAGVWQDPFAYGVNLMGKCPFHDDHTPSFGVTPSKNLWNCLAGCGGGDTIQLVVKKENVSFRQAVEILRQRLGVAPSAAPVVRTRQGTTHSALVADATDLADHVLLLHVMNFYHQ